jgi:hypothetical protein
VAIRVEINFLPVAVQNWTCLYACATGKNVEIYLYWRGLKAPTLTDVGNPSLSNIYFYNSKEIHQSQKINTI